MITNEDDYKDRIFKCDHVEEGEKEKVHIWAGKHTRMRLCRFCCTVAFGTIQQMYFKEKLHDLADLSDGKLVYLEVQDIPQ